MRVFYLFMAALLAAGFPATASARMYFLPDYQSEFYSGNRVQDSDSGQHTFTPSCSDYGLFSAPQNNADCARTSSPAPGLVCYSCTICSADYVYDSSNCSGDYVTSGSSCAGKYHQCICDRSKFPVSSGGCPDGQKIDTSVSCKGPSDTSTYYKCIDDPCAGLTDNTTDLGCESYYDQCPSLCEVGKTCVPNDCSEYTLTSCPTNAVCASCTPGCGDNTARYRERGLSFQVDTPTGGQISFTISGSDYQIDWGDGTVNSETQHTYKLSGKYDINVSGNVSEFVINSSPTAKPLQLYALNLPTAKKITLYPACATLQGTIPPFPAGLTDGNMMFMNCFGLTGSIPALPAGLTNGNSMFSGCSGLTGNIPELPHGLTTAASMFFLGNGLTGSIPKLPIGLINAEDMFTQGINLTGSIPTLPPKLQNGNGMFAYCPNLTGNIPPLPELLTQAESMFIGCSSLTGNIPELPNELSNAGSMFEGCAGLTGNIPELPQTLSYTRGMFSGCSNLTGSIPDLPPRIYNAGQMFANCAGLTGSIPELPSESLSQADGMFRGCVQLGGSAPAKPDKLKIYKGIFRETNVTPTSGWEDQAWQ